MSKKRNVLHNNMHDQIKILKTVSDTMIKIVIKNTLEHTNCNTIVNETKNIFNKKYVFTT